MGLEGVRSAWAVPLLLVLLLAPTCGRAAGSAPEGGDLVDILDVAPTIEVDMRYAKPDNFLHAAVYPCARCLLRREAAMSLASVEKALEARGLRLKLWDCYRPPAVQQAMWGVLPDARFVADPKKGSVHERGGAVDVTLMDASAKELEMPTGHDDFTRKAYADAPASPEAAKNRAALRAAMEAEGWSGIRTEWWHFDAAGSRAWPIEDVALCKAQAPQR